MRNMQLFEYRCFLNSVSLFIVISEDIDWLKIYYTKAHLMSRIMYLFQSEGVKRAEAGSIIGMHS